MRRSIRLTGRRQLPQSGFDFRLGELGDRQVASLVVQPSADLGSYGRVVAAGGTHGPCCMAKLKVFRTAIGFHDAYVAASSKKAALRAWGTEKDLFARGSAELVTDPKLTKEPLASPGVVFKRSRGTAAEQIAALPKSERPAATRAPRVSTPKPATRIKPRPDRSALTEAEDAVTQSKELHAGEIKSTDDKIAELQLQRRSLEKKQATELAKLEKARASLDKTYQRAIDSWRR